jgi:hypothetical protein
MIEMTKHELIVCKCNLEREARHLKDERRELQKRIEDLEQENRFLKAHQESRDISPEIAHNRNAVATVLSFLKQKGA